MKKIDLGQMVSILANLGVLAGIAFLAIEIRQNTRSLEINAYQDVVAQIAQVGFVYTQAPERMEEIHRLLGSAPNDLPEFERTRAAAYVMTLLRHGDLVHLQYQRGVISEERMRSGLTILNTVFCTPYFRGFWPIARAALDSDFGDLLNVSVEACGSVE